MALSYKNDEQSDERLDPYSENARDLYKQEQSAYDRKFDDIKSNFEDTADNTQENANIAKTKNIDGAREQEEAGWKSSYSNKNQNNQKFTAKGLLRKKGPMGFILGMVLGGGGILSMLFSPSIFIVHFTEILIAKYNDQLASMDIRTNVILKKKFEGATSGICGQKISIRCKYTTMSNRQFKALEKAIIAEGGKINTNGEKLLRNRKKITSIEFDGKVIGAADLMKELNTNSKFKATMIKGYNPMLAAFSDKNFSKFAQKHGIIKAKNLKAKVKKDDENITEALREELVNHTSGEAAIETAAGATKTQESCEGGEGCVDGERTVYTDTATGNEISADAYQKSVENTSVFNEKVAAQKALSSAGGLSAGGLTKTALSSTSFGLGAADGACSAYTAIRAVDALAKYAGMLQLMRYFQVYANTAHSIKAMDESTPEAVEFLGNTLTSLNADGKSAGDSFGYKYAAYGDTGGMPNTDNIIPESIDKNGNNVKLSDDQKSKLQLGDEITRYVNGGTVSDSVLAALINAAGGAASNMTTDSMDKTCKFVKGGWGQAIIIGVSVVGVVAAIFSGGASLGWGAAIQGAVSVSTSVAISVALAMLTPKLIDIAAGTVIKGTENGPEAGNALTSGAGGYNDLISQSRGVPALKKADAAEYEKLTAKTTAQYNDIDRLEHSPLDTSNSNTFMGSLVSRLSPYTTKMSSVTGSVSAMSQFAMSSFAHLIPNANAMDRDVALNICKDRDYRDLDLATGPFCEVLHGLKKETLEIDPITVLDYMEKNNYIEKDSESGEPKDSDNDYAKYIKNCIGRSVSIGNYESEDNMNKGTECIQGSHSGAEEYKYNMFRLFYIDQSVDEGMENGEASSNSSNDNSNKTVVSPIANPTITSGYGLRGNLASAPNASAWHAALDIVGNPTDIVAAMDGTVESVQGSGINTIVIKHEDGLRTKYLHIWPKDTIVKAGDKVTAGQKIGVMGCAGKAEGHCSGEHLDFSIWVDGVTDPTKYSKYKKAPANAGYAAGKTINPANFLKDNGVSGYDEAVNEN